MTKRTLTRRRFTLAAGSAAVVGMAGCADDEADDTDDDLDDAADDEADDPDADDVDDQDADDVDDQDADDVDDDPEDEDDDEEDDDLDDIGEEDDAALTIVLENEEGEPVSTGVQITVEELDGLTTHNISEGIEDGQTVVTAIDEGDLLITVESLEEEFEPQEEEVTFEGEDVEVEFVLEGATGDEEADVDEGEDGEEDEEDDA